MPAQAFNGALASGAQGPAVTRIAARRIVFNGRFLASPATGVQRVGRELVLAVDALLAASPELRARYSAELYAPRNVDAGLDLRVISLRQGGSFSGVPWEQLDLPRRRRGGLIVNLCNLGPLVTSAAVTMIHDAQVHDSPGSYSAAFRAWYKTIQPLLGARHKRVLTVSNYSKQQIAAAHIAPASKIFVIHNGVDHVLRVRPAPDVLPRLELRPQNYVLGLASTQPHKNVRVLIDAFKDDRLSSIQLVLFGGADRAEIEHLINGPLPPNVVLAGKVTDGELRSLMAAALCFWLLALLPSPDNA
jgi:glycosyltransferase involved in cell wall biosynthesis